MATEKRAADSGLLHGDITQRILETFFEVYNELGHGFLETVYQSALALALREAGLEVAREAPVEVFFRRIVIGRFHADLLVEQRVVLELKAVRRIMPEHEAQLLHYLRATTLEVGLVLNFGSSPEFKRMVYSGLSRRG